MMATETLSLLSTPTEIRNWLKRQEGITKTVNAFLMFPENIVCSFLFRLLLIITNFLKVGCGFLFYVYGLLAGQTGWSVGLYSIFCCVVGFNQ